MKINIRALVLVYTSIFVCLNLIQCSSLDKIAPEYRGVDPSVQHFVKEYKELAKMQGITFKNEVTIGFKDIKDNSVIGLTTYGLGFREIDLDKKYWSKSTEMTKRALIFHELTHAYCTRGHDFGGGEKYPEFEDWKGHEPRKGHYQDGTGCALSIMYPVVLDDFCMLTHYTDYMQEMFVRCEKY